MGLIWLLMGHLYLSGVQLGVDLRMHTEKICVQKRLDYVLKTFKLFKVQYSK